MNQIPSDMQGRVHTRAEEICKQFRQSRRKFDREFFRYEYLKSTDIIYKSGELKSWLVGDIRSFSLWRALKTMNPDFRKFTPKMKS